MTKKISLIIGGSKGLGKEISQCFSKRGDKVFILSRNIINKKNSIRADITNSSKLKKNFERNFRKDLIDNIVFTQRYRGDIIDDSYQTDLISTVNVLSFLKDK